MKNIIYYIATSLDGYITGPNEDISQFILQGPGVTQYQADLQDFKTTIMGRTTYEFGYAYGLKPGQPGYPHMEHFIFSDTLAFENAADTVHVEKMDIERVKAIKVQSETDIYLCGGGQFAGWLLDHGMIDQLKIKLNPVVLGDGVPLFGDSKTAAKWELIEKQAFEDGMQILTYQLIR